MRNSKEIVQRPKESAEIERAFEPQIPSTTGGYGAYNRDLTQPEGFQFVVYWRIIRKRFWLVVGIAVLLTTISAIYMARKPNVYQARAVILVDTEQVNQDLMTASTSRAALLQDPAYFNTQLQLLWSDGLMRRVVKEFSLDSHKEFQKLRAAEQVSALQSLMKAVGLASDLPNKTDGEVDEISVSPNTSVASSDEINDAIRLAPFVTILKRNLDIEPIRETRATTKDTRLIEVSYRSTDKELAAFVVNGIGEIFAKANQEKRFGTNTKTNDFLQDRIAQLQTEIKQGEMQIFQKTKEIGTIAIDNQQTVALSGLDILNKQLLEAENDRKLAQAEFEAVNRSPESLSARAEQEAKRYTTERETNTLGLKNSVQKQINELNAQRNKLLEEFQPTAQEVKEVDVQIKTLKDGIKEATDSNEEDLGKLRQRIAGELLNNLKTKYLSTKNREDKLRVSYNEKYNEAQRQGQSGVSLNILSQEVATKRGFLTELLGKQRANDVQSAGTANNVSVVEIGIPPELPIGPRRLVTVLGVLFLSTLFGMGLALFLDYLDDTIRTTEEIETYLGLPALAAIPRIDSLPGKRKLLLVGANEDGVTTSNPTNDLLIHRDSRSSLAEAYRQLRTSILLSTAGHAPKTLLVTSSLPSEGKTTTAINTAISLAQTGAKVLIIDADMRRPRLHSVFNKSNAEGLSTILSSDLTEKDVLSIVQYDEEARLNLLPSGPVPPNPAELIGSEQMSNLLKLLQNNFTHVVVDSPPIASFTDGVLVASMVDGVILVVNAGRSSRQVVRRSRQLLMDIGAKIFGVVLNNVNLNASDNSYYYQSYYHRDNYRQDDDE